MGLMAGLELSGVAALAEPGAAGLEPVQVAQGGAAAEAERLFQEGLALYREGSAESLRAAIAKWEAAIPLYQSAGNQQREATALTNIGAVYDALGEKQRALDYYEQALPLRRAVGDRGGGS